MILNRLGNKRRIAKDIIPYFPPHEIYIEMFFGAGGIFFSKPQAKYNFVNDLDSDVYNFWKVIRHRKDEFIKEFLQMPIHNDLFQFWRKNKETDELMQAVRFLFLSNFGFMGKSETLKFEVRNEKEIVLQRIEKTLELIHNVRFTNCDFRQMLNKIQFKEEQCIKDRTFIYADPPIWGRTIIMNVAKAALPKKTPPTYLRYW